MDSIIKKMRVNEISDWLKCDLYGNTTAEPTPENIDLALNTFKRLKMVKHYRFVYLKYIKK